MINKLKLLFLFILSFMFITTNVYAEELNEEQFSEEVEQQEDIIIENDNTTYKIVINDQAHLLTDEEIEKLKDEMTKLTKYGHIAFITIDNNYLSTDQYAREKYHSLFGIESGSLFLIDMSNRYIYIFSFNNIHFYFFFIIYP